MENWMDFALRAAITAVAVWLWLLTQKWIGQRTPDPHGKIGDLVHIWTAPINSYLQKKTQVANGLLISSSLVLDIVGCYLIYQALFGPTIRPLLGLFFLFTLRQINQGITALPTPDGMIWRDPKFPSLFVTYGVSNDLFFSGHTALAVFGAMEISRTGEWPLDLLAAIIIAFEVGTILVLRAHWTMDIFAGAVTAWWTCGLLDSWSEPVDRFLSGLLR